MQSAGPLDRVQIAFDSGRYEEARDLLLEILQTSPDHRDLAADPLPHLSGAYLAALSGASPGAAPGLSDDLAAGSAVMDEFLASDVVVIGVAFYNFTVATQLKAWIDRILVAGKTFRYTQHGAEGLAGGKRVVLAIARGGFYGAETPAASFEHAESYLRAAFAFIGIREIEVVSADGTAVGPEQREQSVKGALERIAEMSAFGRLPEVTT